jgi:hypothetical protein
MSKSTKLTYAALDLAREISRRVWQDSELPNRRRLQFKSDQIPTNDINNIYLFWDQFEPKLQAEFLERTIFMAAASIKGGWELNAWCATQYAGTIERLNELESLKLRQAGKLDVKETVNA